ncbi:hypothetical protein EJ07DRAFT_99257 [Lizonia empirigonia]|nr:hypothetical protein EJ07DRAFT_99257 [Lizonia empirigonia]
MSIKSVFITSALAASSVVNAAVLPVRQASSTGPTCSDKAVGATFITKLASDNQYDVTCGADYFGNDLEDGLTWTSDFAGCLTACDAEAGCSTVAYVNGACYLKHGVPTLQGNDAVWSAKKTPPPTCDGGASDGALYATAAGNFQIICGKDYGGNDLPSFGTDSFSACIDACAADQSCVDVSYVYGACYPKFALSTPSDASWVWTAKFIDTRASDSTVSIPSISTPEVAKALSCIEKADNNKPYTAKTGGSFIVECAVDYWGADIGSVDGTTTFEGCIDYHCNANTECGDVSWVWGACYMKNAVNAPGQAVDHVWTGRRITARVAEVSSFC